MNRLSQTLTGTAREAPVILCCEDEAALRHDIAEELREAGYRAVEAADGNEALDQIAACRPDLILCDITMPGMDGRSLLERLRGSHPELDDVPFLFLTALAQPRAVIEGKRAGADDYLVKPVDYDLLLATIEARLRQMDRVRGRAQHHDNSGGGSGYGDGDVSSDSHEATGAAALGAGALLALDHLAAGVVVLAPGAQVLHANRTARALARAPDLAKKMQLEPGRKFAAQAAGAVLRRIIADAEAAAGQNRDHSASLTLPRGEAEHGLLLTVLALPGEARAPVLVFLSDPGARNALPPRALAEMFGLTPSECQVARLLAGGLRPDGIAAEMGVAPTTVAFHLRNIFSKTGSRRQADLVALVLAAPLIPSD